MLHKVLKGFQNLLSFFDEVTTNVDEGKMVVVSYLSRLSYAVNYLLLMHKLSTSEISVELH